MQPKVYSQADHGILHERIDNDALFVIDRLQGAGHAAYLVGGGVRDLLTDQRPKDFDVSTSATPGEVKELFRRHCMLIGRRFRLAHVRFGSNIIEVSTFRAGEESSELVLRDNEWGSAEDDAFRRDFRINGLFYDPTTREVIDYVEGWQDIQAGHLHTIGDPETRFKQDPVRMIRLLKFRARFGFTIDETTERAVYHHRHELEKSSPARVMEEFLRMLESGAAKPFIALLEQHSFLPILFPWLGRILQTEEREILLALLNAIDETKKLGRPLACLDRATLFSCLLYPILYREIERASDPSVDQISQMVSMLLRKVNQNSFSHLTKRLRLALSSILNLQYRICPLHSKVKSTKRLSHHPDLPLALGLIHLRNQAGEDLKEPLARWEEQLLNWRADHQRHPEGRSHKARRRRRFRGSKSASR